METDKVTILVGTDEMAMVTGIDKIMIRIDSNKLDYWYW